MNGARSLTRRASDATTTVTTPIASANPSILPLASADRDVTVRLKLHPLVDGRAKLVQRVRVSAATTPLTEWSVAETGEFLAVIPAAVLQQQVSIPRHFLA